MKPVYKHKVNELFLPVDGYTHIVQTLISINGGQTFYYAGNSKYFRSEAEANQYRDQKQAQEPPAQPAGIPLEAETPARSDGDYYYFDCLDGIIGDRLLTPQEISARLYGEVRELSEADIKGIAADYEAELYRYTYKDGEQTGKKKLVSLIC